MSESRKKPVVLPGTAPARKAVGRPPALNCTTFALARLAGYKPKEAALLSGSTMTGRKLQEQARRQEKSPVQAAELERLRGIDGVLEQNVAMQWPRAWATCQLKMLSMLSDPLLGNGDALQLIKLFGQITGKLNQDGAQITVVQVAHTEEARERILEMQADPKVQAAALTKLQAVINRGENGRD